MKPCVTNSNVEFQELAFSVMVSNVCHVMRFIKTSLAVLVRESRWWSHALGSGQAWHHEQCQGREATVGCHANGQGMSHRKERAKTSQSHLKKQTPAGSFLFFPLSHIDSVLSSMSSNFYVYFKSL